MLVYYKIKEMLIIKYQFYKVVHYYVLNIALVLSLITIYLILILKEGILKYRSYLVNQEHILLQMYCINSNCIYTATINVAL
jgi:hypothetical protein